MEKYTKSWLLFVLGPILLTPILAVEFPRVLAYLPLLSLLSGSIILWRAKVRVEIPKKAFLILFVLLGLGALSTFGINPSEDATERFSKLVLFSLLGSVFLIVMLAGRRFVTPKLSILLLVSCSIAAFVIFLEVLFGAPLYKMIRADVDAASYTMAMFNRGALVVTFISLFILFLERHKRELSFYALYLPILAMLFFVESQSSQVAVIAGLFFYFVFPTRKKWAWYGLYAVFSIGVLTAPFMVQKAFNAIPDTIHDAPIMQTAYVGNRLEIWDFVARKALERPIVGHGLEYTKGYTKFDNAHRFLKGDVVLHPHSAVLQIWIEFGIVGVTVLLMLAACFFRALYRINDAIVRKAATSVAGVIFLVSCFSYGMWQSWWLGLLFIIAGIIISNLPYKEHRA